MNEDSFIIARKAKMIVNFIEKNISNFPNEHIVLKNRIIESFMI